MGGESLASHKARRHHDWYFEIWPLNAMWNTAQRQALLDSEANDEPTNFNAYYIWLWSVLNRLSNIGLHVKPKHDNVISNTKSLSQKNQCRSHTNTDFSKLLLSMFQIIGYVLNTS